MSCPEREYIENAVAALSNRDQAQAKHDLVATSIAERELWLPTHAAALKAIEVRLQEDISREERAVLREIEFKIIHGRSEA